MKKYILFFVITISSILGVSAQNTFFKKYALGKNVEFTQMIPLESGNILAFGKEYIGETQRVNDFGDTVRYLTKFRLTAYKFSPNGDTLQHHDFSFPFEEFYSYSIKVNDFNFESVFPISSDTLLAVANVVEFVPDSVFNLRPRAIYYKLDTNLSIISEKIEDCYADNFYPDYMQFDRFDSTKLNIFGTDTAMVIHHRQVDFNYQLQSDIISGDSSSTYGQEYRMKNVLQLADSSYLITIGISGFSERLYHQDLSFDTTINFPSILLRFPYQSYDFDSTSLWSGVPANETLFRITKRSLDMKTNKSISYVDFGDNLHFVGGNNMQVDASSFMTIAFSGAVSPGYGTYITEIYHEKEESDIRLSRLDTLGTFLCDTVIGDGSRLILDVVTVTDSGIVALGRSWDFVNHASDSLVHFFIAKFNFSCQMPDTVLPQIGLEENIVPLQAKIYPNPFDNILKIDMSTEVSFSIYDLSAKRFENFSQNLHFGTNELSLENLPQGAYIVEFKQKSGQILRKKVLKM